MLDTFPLNRYAHCYGVGKRMYAYAKYKLGWEEQRCKEMFVLGSIHDIGYELDSDAFKHDYEMANALAGYKYRNEIRNHSKLTYEYESPELDLIYFGDMTVDGKGDWCTFEDRLSDLERRYGIDSLCYTESKDIVDYLLSKGFDDSLK